MKDEHVKDAAQDVAEDVMQDVAGDVLGAAEDGSLKVLIVARVSSSGATHAQHKHAVPRGSHVTGEPTHKIRGLCMLRD